LTDDAASHKQEPTPRAQAIDAIPSTLRSPGAGRFWLAVLLTGIGTGLGAAALTRILEVVQQLVWGGTGRDILAAAEAAGPERHILALLAAGLITGATQLVLKQVTNANSIDVTAAIWFYAGRLPAVRTLGSALLSVVIVGMGVSLGREGAPKQVGAVLANFFSDQGKLSDEQRKLLVACGAGAGMAAAYGVPLGGALFAIEVLRGMLALRFVLPALFTSMVATGVSWLFLPDAPTYHLPSFSASPTMLLWALIAGPIAGVCSVGYVRAVTLAERSRPEGWKRLVAPVLILTLCGVISIWYPQILGNGKDIAQLAFMGRVAPALLLALVFIKPAATLMSLGSGAPGGLFTPSLTLGAMLGGVLGWAWSLALPGAQAGLCALLGAGAVLAATTQGPVSSVVLLMEMTGGDRSFILPLLVAVGTATLVSRTIEPRSIYDARLSDEEIAARMRTRDQPLPATK
jgi:CIC family chloride channel protein